MNSKEKPLSTSNLVTKSTMTAIFTPTDPSSPSLYSCTQTALLLLDFQNFTIAQCPSGSTAVSNASTLRNWALTNEILIIHSIVDLSASDKIPLTTKNHENLKSRIQNLSSDSNSGLIPPDLAPSKGSNEVICLKTPGIVSALSMPDVPVTILKEKGIKSLVLAGLSTSGAVLRTATQATDSGFVVSVIEDACGDQTEDVHEIVVGKILGNRCHVCTAGEWVKEWEGRGSG